MEYQNNIGELTMLIAQQSAQMREFEERLQTALLERGKSAGNPRNGVATKIVFVTVAIIISIVGSVTVYYVNEDRDWKKTMRADFAMLQGQFHETSKSIARIETMLKTDPKK